MNSIELRIGNLVNHVSFGISKVNAINEESISVWYDGKRYWDDSRFIEPILLTEEILLKAGFVLQPWQHALQGFDVYKLDNLTFNKNHNKFWYKNSNDFKQPESLHQLQNLYFALTGKELNTAGLI